MIITLIGADFSGEGKNIGTLSTWSISRVIGEGATYSGPTYVDKEASLSATVTLDEGYSVGTAGVTVTMGGSAVEASSISGQVITISIESVTGNVVIKVPTVDESGNESSGNESTGGNEGSEEEGTSIFATATLMDGYACQYTSAETYTNESFYTYKNIPVEAGKVYAIPGMRNAYVTDANETFISGVSGLVTHKYKDCPSSIIIPNNGAYLTYCAKYENIAAEDVVGLESVVNDGDVLTANHAFFYNGRMNGYNFTDTDTIKVAYYFAVVNYPVTAGVTYNIPYARVGGFYDSTNTVVGSISGGGSATATVTAPDGATFMNISYKYADLASDEWVITEA